MNQTTRKIVLPLKIRGSRLFIYKREVPVLIIAAIFTIISFGLLTKYFSKNIGWGWFFPAILCGQILVIFFRPKPIFKNEMSTEMWDSILKGDGPFQYDSNGFIVTIKELGVSKVKWSDIHRIVAYRNEYFPHDETGLELFADNDVSFAVPELTPGCMKFFRNLQENLEFSNDNWFGEISAGNNSLTIYQRSSERPKD